MKIKSSVAVACFFPGRAKDLSAPLYILLPCTPNSHNAWLADVIPFLATQVKFTHS